MPAVEVDYPRAVVVVTLDVNGEAEPVDVAVIPRRVSVTRRPHTHADTADIELDGTQVPFDPRMIHNAVITVHMGQARGMEDNGWRTEATRRFVGYIDTLDGEQDDDDDTVSIKARDLSAMLRDAKPLPANAVPLYSDTLESAIQRILDEVPGGEALDLYFTEESGGDVPLGPLVSVRAQSGPVHLEPDVTAWGAIEYVAGMVGCLVNVELDRVVVRLPREVYAHTQAPRASLVFNSETANVVKLATQKKFVRNRKGVRVVCFDPFSRRRLEADYPPDLPPRTRPRAPSSGARGRRRTAPAPARPPDRDVFPVQGVQTEAGLLEVARGIWQERSRQEIAVTADTPYFTEDFLGMRNGDRVRVQLNRALAAGLTSSQTTEARVGYVMRRLGIERRAAEVLVRAAERPGADIFYVHEVTVKWAPDGDLGAHLELINMIALGAADGP